MHENEQQLNKSDELKKAYVSSGIMLFVLVIAIILAVFAWFTVKTVTSSAGTVELRANDNLKIEYNTVVGTPLSSGKVSYPLEFNSSNNLNDENFNENANIFYLYPGEKKYFKTVVYNFETTEGNLTGRVNLQNLLVNKAMFKGGNVVAMSFSSTINDSTTPMSNDLADVSYSFDNTYNLIAIQPLTSTITLPEATSPSKPGEVTIYWSVTLNGYAVDNDLMAGLSYERGESEEPANTEKTLSDLNAQGAEKPTAAEAFRFQNIKFTLESRS